MTMHGLYISAILVASVVAAAAGDAFICGGRYVFVIMNDEGTVQAIQFPVRNRRVIRAPVFVRDTKTGKATLGGKRCVVHE
jgi:hypothetical protein